MTPESEPIRVDVRSIFRGGFIPPGLGLFAEDAEQALEDMLLGRALLGHLDPAEPVELLLDWLEASGPRFALAVDHALARWIARSWGQPILPETGRTAAVTAEAWVHACELMASEPGKLGESVRALREHMPERREFLASLREGPARDPEGRAWRVLARSQSRGKRADRELIDDWWRLCRLDVDVPWYHGEYGIEGLRWIEPSRQAKVKGGGFPVEVGEGLLRLAAGLAQRAQEGWLEETFASDEFRRVARLTERAYPHLAPRWVAFWREALQGKGVGGELVPAWIVALHAEELRERPVGSSFKPQWLEPDPEWAERAEALRQSFGRGEPDAVKKAKALLREQRAYAEATGDGFYFGRSAGKLATAIKGSDPEQALRWVHEGRHLDPANDHAWTMTADLLLELGRFEEAQSYALEATQLFPNNPVACSTVVEVLRARQRFEEAEAVCFEGIQRFPENDRLATALAEIYKAQGRAEEAETAYRESIRRFGDNPVGYRGLATLYRDLGRFDEAKTVLHELLDVMPGLPDAIATLRAVEREERAEEVAEPVAIYGGKPQESHSLRQPEAAERVAAAEPPELRAEDVEILTQDAYLLRRWWRLSAGEAPAEPGKLRERARKLLAALSVADDRFASAAGERGLLALEIDELESTLELLRAAVGRFPGSARVRYGLARAERLLVERRPPEEVTGGVILPWRRLERVDERLRPTALLGAGRTWLCLANGSLPEMAARGARDSFGQLGYWIEHVLEAERREAKQRRRPVGSTLPFLAFQASRLRQGLFEGEVISSAADLEDLTTLAERTREKRREFDEIEEAFVRRLAA